MLFGEETEEEVREDKCTGDKSLNPWGGWRTAEVTEAKLP